MGILPLFLTIKSKKGSIVMPGVYYVRKGIFEKDGFRVVRDLTPISAEKFEEFCKKMEGYLLSLDSTNTSSYDDSDDERVESSSRVSYSSIYRELNPKNNAESLLMVDGEIVGVVYVINKGKSDEYTRAFSFDGKIAQTMRLGYSASHSSSFTWIDRVSLAKKGENGVPETAKEADFFQSEMFPSL